MRQAKSAHSSRRSRDSKLISSGVATGGMQAKIEAAITALRNGVKQVLIAPGRSRGHRRPATGGLPHRNQVHSWISYAHSNYTQRISEFFVRLFQSFLHYALASPGRAARTCT